MALTRRFLKSMQLTDEQIESVIEEHTATVDGLKEQIRTYKEDAEKLPDTQKKLADAEKDLAGKTKELEAANDWKAKYEKEHSDFDKYKTQVDEEKTAENIRGLYRGLLKENNIDEKRYDDILRITDMSTMKVGQDGKLEGAEDLSKEIAEKWSGFVVKSENRPAPVDNPPANNGGNSMTKEDILDIKDTAERQKAIAEHLDLFQ